MLDVLIVPESALDSQIVLLRQLAQNLPAVPQIVDDPVDYGRALLFYIAFSNPLVLPQIGITVSSNLMAYYNRYYWIRKFSKLYSRQIGYDAGVEQQVFAVLEEAPPDCDWSVIQTIDAELQRDS